MKIKITENTFFRRFKVMVNNPPVFRIDFFRMPQRVFPVKRIPDYKLGLKLIIDSTFVYFVFLAPFMNLTRTCDSRWSACDHG